MDISTLATTILSDDTIEGVSRATGASNKDVLNVLAAALPALLSGANTQATQSSTSSGFANALQSHAKDDTSSLLSFLTNADLKDGNAILGHLLGSNQEATTTQISQQTGVSKKNTGLILACIAPLLLSLLGKALQGNNKPSSNGGNAFTTAAVTALMSGLLGGGKNSLSGLASLLGGVLGGGSSASSQSGSSLNLLSSLLGGGASAASQQSSPANLLSSLLGGSSSAAPQQTASFNPLSSLLGGLGGLLNVDPTKMMPGADEEEEKK
jgi:hypothetical protein